MYRLVFFGTPPFTLPVLEAILSLGPTIEIAAVVTAPDSPAGRGQKIASPPVKQWAVEHKILVLQPDNLNDPRFLADIASLAPSVGVIAAYGKIIPKTVLDQFPKGVLNVHPSLLPKWRGPSPVQMAVLHGDRETGVTIMLTDEQMDHGPIIAQEKVALFWVKELGEMYAARVPRPRGEALTEMLFERGAVLLARVLVPLLKNDRKAVPQNHAEATYSKKLSREDGRIAWHKSSNEIDRMVRAYQPWPGTFTLLPDGKRLRVLEALGTKESNISSAAQAATPGLIQEREWSLLGGSGTVRSLIVRTLDGTVELRRVQPEGKPPMTGIDFLDGHRDLIGKTLK